MTVVALDVTITPDGGDAEEWPNQELKRGIPDYLPDRHKKESKKMDCEKCGYKNPDENKFCGNCAAPLSATGGVTLKDLLETGLLKAGGELTIAVRGKDVIATLLPDGRISYQNQVFDGPLAAATGIRGQTCDGWHCWKAMDHATGQSHGISHYRSAFLKGKPH